ncbi:hypothetical protein C8Q74DRAFT_1367103 [Fomes fomentarius]|nr:hypothetical protein C8Q74DRAFT_1367103 [Fomes fomentarius]
MSIKLGGNVQLDEDLWFEDGNVIVIAQERAFRFHRGALSRHSDVFCGLFSLPQPTSRDVVDTLDGISIVHVPDTAYDFKHLLRAIYDGVHYFAPTGAVEFSVLASLTRMSHKYQLDAIYDECIRRLKTIFTTDFSIWQQHQGLSTSNLTVHPGNAVEAFNLFRVIGRTEMLPTALYACGRLSVSELLSGSARADGTVEKLGSADLERCMQTRIQLVKYDAQIAARFFDAQPPSSCICPSTAARSATLQSRARAAVTDYPTLLDAEPLSKHFSEVAEDLAEDGVICRGCADMLKGYHFALRQRVWWQLPEIMNLDVDGWPGDL